MKGKHVSNRFVRKQIYLPLIEESRIDREEIEKIALLKEISVRMVIHGRVNGG